MDSNVSQRRERLRRARAIGTHSAAEWRALVRALGGVCMRCQSADGLVKDHIVPLYQVEFGPSDSIDNLQPLCRRCNSAKGPDDTDYRPADWPTRYRKALEG